MSLSESEIAKMINVAHAALNHAHAATSAAKTALQRAEEAEANAQHGHDQLIEFALKLDRANREVA